MEFVTDLTNQSAAMLESYLYKRNTQDMRFHWSNKQIDSHLKSQKPWLAIANENEIVAIVLFSALPQLIDIHYLETRPEFIRQGFMENLLEELKSRYSNALFWLEVHEGNKPARTLYAKLGFKIKALRKKYYRDGANSLQMSTETSK